MISLLFGAGASFGSGASPAPPLGPRLFEELLKLEGYFHRLPEATKSMFLKEGFEKGMAEVANDANELNPLQKELACYLSSFQSTPDNAYTRLFRRVARHKVSLNITTLNYDLLIEQSMLFSGWAFDYNPNPNRITLNKIHGSCNFLPDSGGIQVENCRMTGFQSIAEGLQTHATLSHDEILAWCSNPRNEWLSPVLALYQSDKRIFINRKLVDEIQRRHTEQVLQSSHIAVIGVKHLPHDQHIWQPIAQSNAEILIIDPFPEPTLAWARKSGVRRIRCIPKSFDRAVWDICKFVSLGTQTATQDRTG